MKRNCFKAMGGLILLLLSLMGFAAGETAEDITGECEFRLCATDRKYTTMTDKKYTSYWESRKIKNPYVIITSKKPMYGLYLCFRKMPDSYELQIPKGSGKNQWQTLCPGDTRFEHAYYELDGQMTIRIYSTQTASLKLGFNEIFVFGKGESPDWVQKWEPAEEKADILFFMAHPDDELLFLGGAIPYYDTQLAKRVVVAYLSWSNTTRRSEALNGLWSMGVRNYPEFGGFMDSYSISAKDAYKKLNRDKVLSWVTGLFRRHRPDAVVTHDLDGEYGHGQHKMVADACIQAYDLAANASKYPESAEEYGTWQVSKLYLHLYGNEDCQTRFDWRQPMSAFGGKTGLELAHDAYALHLTQVAASVKIRGKWHKLSVEDTGEAFPNTVFGLYASTVGPDESHLDFLEHITEKE